MEKTYKMKIRIEKDKRIDKFRKRYKNQKPSFNIYSYDFKHASNMSFEDWVDLAGIEGACKIVSGFGRGYIYIPSFERTKNRFKHALMRYEYKKLIKEGIPIEQSTELLVKKYGYTRSWTRVIVASDNPYSKDKKILIDAQRKDNKIRDERLFEVLAKDWELLKKYGFI